MHSYCRNAYNVADRNRGNDQFMATITHKSAEDAYGV
jgi:hypothetical protein